MAISNFSYSQSTLSEQQVIEYTILSQELEGTYQIQMIDTRSLPTTPLSIFPMIRDARTSSSVTYIEYSENMRIMVLPLNIIESKDFVPVKKITYINSSEL